MVGQPTNYIQFIPQRHRHHSNRTAQHFDLLNFVSNRQLYSKLTAVCCRCKHRFHHCHHRSMVRVSYHGGGSFRSDPFELFGHVAATRFCVAELSSIFLMKGFCSLVNLLHLRCFFFFGKVVFIEGGIVFFVQFRLQERG